MSQPIHVGPLRITKTVDGFHKMNPKTKFIFETVDSLFKACVMKDIYGVWIEAPNQKEMDVQVYTNGIHGIQHAILNIAPIYSISSSHFLTHCCGYQTMLTKILIYDCNNRKTPIYTLAEYLPTILMRARQLIRDCDCEDGCIKCVLMVHCASRNKCVSRKDSLMILDTLLVSN
jgi:DEAD/DEAH box helicase domain-containing protein